jgi:hypothetical protein
MIEINDFETVQAMGLFVKVFTTKYDRSASSFISDYELENAADEKALIELKVEELKQSLTDFVNRERKDEIESLQQA